MNSLNWWQNRAGEVLVAGVYIAMLALIGWAWNERVPVWAFYLAAAIGILAWSRPPYYRPQDFNK